MKLSWKAGIALVIGGIALGSTLSSHAQQQDTDAPEKGDVTMAARPAPGGHGPHIMRGDVVRSETFAEGDEEGTFKTLRTDAGTLKAVEGNTLTIEEADGRTLEITVDDDTEIRREREKASVGDLKVGDHVMAHRVQEGDGGFVTEHVFAIPAERYAEMEANREACTDDSEATECEGPPHGRGGKAGPGGPLVFERSH